MPTYPCDLDIIDSAKKFCLAGRAIQSSLSQLRNSSYLETARSHHGLISREIMPSLACEPSITNYVEKFYLIGQARQPSVTQPRNSASPAVKSSNHRLGHKSLKNLPGKPTIIDSTKKFSLVDRASQSSLTHPRNSSYLTMPAYPQ